MTELNYNPLKNLIDSSLYSESPQNLSLYFYPHSLDDPLSL